MTFQLHVLTDEPKWSSAALCITLDHLGRTFRPEYTHQLVGDECWRGHQPLESILREANADFNKNASSTPSPCGSVLHKSHKDHHEATSQLEIRVTLSPSCQNCRVNIIRSESKSGSEDHPDAKRRRTDSGPGSSTVESTIGSNDGGPMPSSFSMQPMKDSEIMDALCKALPPMTLQDGSVTQVEDSFLSEPIGDVLEEFSIPVKKLNGDNDKSISKNFVITIANGRSANVSQYHKSVQNLSLFYIENADTVDVANDNDGGFWKIMYIFQKHDGDEDENGKKQYQYSLVGFFTLFHFISLFRKPDPGIIVRVCQALILPPFQGQGHGRRLLQNVYKLAQQKQCTIDGNTQHGIVQVNVEDPAPAFVALRNKLDFEYVLEHHTEWKWPEKGSIWGSDSLAPSESLSVFFAALTEKEASEISNKAKIVPKQIQIANELLKLKAIQDAIAQHRDRIKDTDKDAIERLFRLMVKRRLNKEHREELLEEPSKEAQKALLAKLFDKELLGYNRILSKIR